MRAADAAAIYEIRPVCPPLVSLRKIAARYHWQGGHAAGKHETYRWQIRDNAWRTSYNEDLRQHTVGKAVNIGYMQIEDTAANVTTIYIGKNQIGVGLPSQGNWAATVVIIPLIQQRRTSAGGGAHCHIQTLRSIRGVVRQC